MASFYDDDEPWTPRRDEYLTWDDAIRYYISRTKNGKRLKGDVIAELSKFVHDIWSAGDGCPKTYRGISYQFEHKVLATYLRFRKNSGNRSHHKKDDTKDVKQATRRSTRVSSSTLPESIVLPSDSETHATGKV